MGRIVAIAGGDLKSNHPINKYIVNMDKKSIHNLLFIGTASEDAEGYINNIRITFEPMNCCVKALCLSVKEYMSEEIDELLEWADMSIVLVVIEMPYKLRDLWVRRIRVIDTEQYLL